MSTKQKSEESKTLKYNVNSLVSSVSFKFYYEQCGYRAIDKTFEEQANILKDVLIKLKTTSDYYIDGIVHDKDDVESYESFFVPSTTKPHCHLIVSVINQRTRIGTILNFLAMYGINFDANLDYEMLLHGMTVLNRLKHEDERMFVYLTHETFNCLQTLKHQYDRSEVVTNRSADNVNNIYSFYFMYLNGNKKKKISTIELTPDVKSNLFHAADQYGSSGKSFSDFWNMVHFDFKNNEMFKRQCYSYYRDAVTNYVLANPFKDKVSIFISMPPNYGKTYGTFHVLKELTGKEPYFIKDNANQHNGAADNYAVGSSLVFDDCFPPSVLDIADSQVSELYVRNKNNVPFNGDYLVIISNQSFEQFINYYRNHYNYTETQLSAIRSRFFSIYVTGPADNKLVNFDIPQDLRCDTDKEAYDLMLKFYKFYEKLKASVISHRAALNERKYDNKTIMKYIQNHTIMNFVNKL